MNSQHRWQTHVDRSRIRTSREHIESETQDNIARGMSAREARYAAHRKFGNVARVIEDTREVWSRLCGSNNIGKESSLQPCACLRKNPSSSPPSPFSLSRLGSAPTPPSSVLVRGVLLRPLVNRDENRLIYIRQSAEGLNVDNIKILRSRN